ncbi:MAG: CDP-alcohol phosphatidyltransferase family protein [Gammaproteobacteria bacterium]
MPGVENQAATRSLLSSLLFSGLAVGALSIAASRLPGFGSPFVLATIAAFAVAALPLSILAWRHLDAPSFGAANAVTLIRLALTAMLAALLLTPASASSLWFCIATATCALLLDGLDGRLARRAGAASRFGARFDMEVDALLVCVLALLAWHFERAGIWVLAAGLLRYVFVAAARVIPWLRETLPESLRRKTICIVQSTALLVCMGPIVPQNIAPWIAAAGVLLLGYSFAIDVLWLYGRRRLNSHA